MNYRLRREDRELGTFSFEELQRRRESGELTGSEEAQREGDSDWHPLHLVLGQAYAGAIPPLLPQDSKARLTTRGKWLIAATGVLVICVFAAHFGPRAIRYLHPPPPVGLETASRSVQRASTPTDSDVQKRMREFRARQWIEGYEKRGIRNPSSDAEAKLFVQVFADRDQNGPQAKNPHFLETESDRLGRDPNCTDPLVLTVAAYNSINWYDRIHRYERAVAAYPGSSHRAYPALFAAVGIMEQSKFKYDQEGELNVLALQLLPKCFSDGSFTPADQQEIADIFVHGWGSGFFELNGVSICDIVRKVGPSYAWLALVLDGQRCITEAWRQRGDDYAYAVNSKGWQGFNENLAQARKYLTEASNREPSFPIAPCLMMTVSLGDSGLGEMRTWFDRTLSAQFDYSYAWSNLRWGLRPRWYGSTEAMLAFGKMALATGRFDTDVPRVFLDSVTDLESEDNLPAGTYIFGRPDIWPDMQHMYESYIAEPSQAPWRGGWRTAYAVVAYFAGKYAVAREQLEALEWKPDPKEMLGWNVELSGMPIEIAARTGALGSRVSDAETARLAGHSADALKQYTELESTAIADERTREFVQLRRSRLADEESLREGKWVSLLPAHDHDANWVYSFGEARKGADGSLDVESGRKGHMLFSKTPVGRNFEVRGSFENVRSSNTNFQAGIVMGLPDFDKYTWFGFRMKRHDEEGSDVVCFGLGWTLTEILQRVVLKDTTNSFDFVLQNGLMTASVNGEEVFRQAEPPRAIDVPDGSYLVGLGAFSDSDDAVVRYRDVEVRRLQ